MARSAFLDFGLTVFESVRSIVTTMVMPHSEHSDCRPKASTPE